MTHPIHKYRAIAAKWDEILNDGGKLRRPITTEECCRMVLVMKQHLTQLDLCYVDVDLAGITRHISQASNGV